MGLFDFLKPKSEFLPKPKTNKAEILYVLLENKKVSLKDFPFLAGFRTRISELINEHGLKLTKKPIVSKNKFGNTFTYVEHHLSLTDVYFATQLYFKINQ